MKISQEVREFARLNPASTTLASSISSGVAGVMPLQQVQLSLQDKAQEFRAGGSEIYQ
jgi:phosphomethylpyrimidine synthase